MINVVQGEDGEQSAKRKTGYLIHVSTADRTVRRAYLTLLAATSAADRAREKGHDVHVEVIKYVSAGKAR